MNTKINKNILGITIFFGMIHMVISTGYWDDNVMAHILSEHGGNIYNMTVYRWNEWSSRIFIEIPLAILGAVPEIIWKILDIFVIILLYTQLEQLLEKVCKIKSKENSFLLMLLLMAYPFCTMASTGWIATTLNYLWVISFVLYLMNRLWKLVIEEKKLNVYEIIMSTLALLYCASFESMTAILFMTYIGYFIYLFYKKKNIPLLIISHMLIIVGLLVYILLCPGNKLRPLVDIPLWMPEFPQLNLVDKIRMGIVTAFMHFLSVPSAIFFLLNVLCLTGGVFNKKFTFAHIVPLIINIFWTCYYMLNYLFGKKVFTYQIPEPLLKGGSGTVEQLAVLGSAIIWFVAVIYSLYTIIKKKEHFIYSLCVLFVGCIPALVLGMTATVVTSMLRTSIYIYMSLIILICIVLDNISEKLKQYKWLRVFIYLVIVVGILLNCFQVMRHISIYE